MSALYNHARLHRLEQMSLKSLRSLDRERTVVLIPFGMIEQHGEHLPLGTDGYAVEAVNLAAVAWLLEHDPELHALLLPAIPFGTDPVDLRRPELFETSGSIWISRETLRAILVDITGHLIRYGFRYIFPVGFHGGADQSRVFSEVCAEMRAAHPGLVMYEPIGYVLAGAEMDVRPGLATLLGRPLTPQEEVVLKGSIHASMFETSMMLHLRPDLVDPMYKNLRSIEWKQLYSMPDWPGYVGAAPAHANADIGAAFVRWRGVRAAALIRRAMAGEDLSTLPRHPAWEEEETPSEAGVDVRQAGESIEGAALEVEKESGETKKPIGEPSTPASSDMDTRPLKKPDIPNDGEKGEE